MSIIAKALGDCWGCDADTIFTDASATLLKATPYQLNPPPAPAYTLEFLVRYVTDVTLAERDAILVADWTLLLIEHSLAPSWQATGALGSSRALTAITAAKKLEYPEGCTLILDMQGVGDPGTNADAFVRDYATAVNDAGYKLVMYEGYDDGFTDATRSALVLAGPVYGLWADFGPRTTLPGIGFLCKQSATVTLGGTPVDPDHASPDAQGRTFIGMALKEGKKKKHEPAAPVPPAAA